MKLNIKTGSWLIFCLLSMQTSLFATTVLAAKPCGDIIAPRYFYEYFSGSAEITTRAIVDCNDPFWESTEPPSPYSLMVDGKDVISGESVFVPEGGTSDIKVKGVSTHAISEAYLFYHDGDDYRHHYLRAPDITPNQYLAYLPIYFANSPDLALYLVVATVHFAAGDTWDYFKDSEGNPRLDQSGAKVEEIFFGFLDAADEVLATSAPMARAGTYTLVIKEYELIPMAENTWRQNLQDFFIKTANAGEVAANLTYTITFTINERGPAVGVASVLFLPGIMGSRIFEESAACSIFGAVAVRERWPSGSNCDIARLAMNELGLSANPIFTTVEKGLVEDIGVVVNLYESMLEDLEEWKEDGLIADYKAVPYDWRLAWADILLAKNIGGRIVFDTSGTYKDGYIYQSLKALVDASPKQKVVLIGHSNGGLIIQTLLSTMKANNDLLLPAVEKVILIAVPQTGTPESIIGMLHGLALGPLGAVISHEESRQLMNTSPFAYQLLPSAQYYDMTTTPVITFDSGTLTDAWITKFGAKLETREAMKAFISKDSGRDTPTWDDVLTPATAHPNLLVAAQVAQLALGDWRPGTTTVYEVAGVGIATPATLSYFTDTKCTRVTPTTGGAIPVCLEYAPQLGYRVAEVVDGDGTVVAGSAVATLAGSGVEKWWLDLLGYNDEYLDRKHRDILEAEDVRSFIINVVAKEANVSYEYLATTSPNYTNTNRLVYQLHSPLDLFVSLDDGQVVGSSTPTLRGIEYRRYGEVQYLSIPSAESGYEVRLSGLGSGSFTLDIEEYAGNVIKERVTYSALPSSTSTKVVITPTPTRSLSDARLKIDYEGDGVFELVARPGLGQVTWNPASTTTAISLKLSQSKTRTRVGQSGLKTAPGQALLVGSSGYRNADDELRWEFISILTQYRDLLIKLRVQ